MRGEAARDPSSQPLLEVSELRVAFRSGGRRLVAVDGVSFRVEPGEVVGIVGESGCGKTVTALSVMGLLPEPQGELLPGSSIRWKGEELVGAPASRLRRLRGREVGMVFQEPMTSLNPVLRIGRQIAEGLRLHEDLSRKEAARSVVALLGEVGIGDPELRARQYPHQLSGGMRQRAMVAMALACRPSLLIADEPTTALDVTIQAQILELLRKLRKDREMALLLITHDLGVVAEMCHKVVVMYAGEVVEVASVEKLFADPRHPYTRGLLDSLPGAGEMGRPLRPIPGGVPSPDALPTGCRFHPRCSHAWERCRGEAPGWVVGEEGGARCFLAEEEG